MVRSLAFGVRRKRNRNDNFYVKGFMGVFASIGIYIPGVYFLI